MRRVIGAITVLVLCVFGFVLWQRQKPSEDVEILPGGRLIATTRAEPTNFNRLVVGDTITRLTALLAHDTLVRVDPSSGALEPRLARDWSLSPDGLSWTFNLRQGVTFSDGTPFTAADVAFTFAALYDSRTLGALGSEVRVHGKPLRLDVIGPFQVRVSVEQPWGPGPAILASVPILPKHKLESALESGSFASAWSVGVNPREIVGLGPFVLKEYNPGRNLLFGRNMNYWRADADGRQLPYLDEILLEITPSQDAEVNLLLSGHSDLTSDAARADDLAVFRTAASNGQLQLLSTGPSIDTSTFWFNLKDGSPATQGKPWLRSKDFRTAVSLAINRQAIVDTVHLGAAAVVYGPITPGHGEWYDQNIGATGFDQDLARKRLSSLKFTDTNGDGLLEDPVGNAVRFSILTQSGHTERERTSAMIAQQLRQVGIVVDVVSLNAASLISKYNSGDYEVIYFGVRADSIDPTTNLGFWLSSGVYHFWNPRQVTPATEWEREVDTLMLQQISTMDLAQRRKLFRKAQQILADNAPALWFAAAETMVPVSSRLGGVTVRVTAPHVLWNADSLWFSRK